MNETYEINFKKSLCLSVIFMIYRRENNFKKNAKKLLT